MKLNVGRFRTNKWQCSVKLECAALRGADGHQFKGGLERFVDGKAIGIY